MSVAIFLKGSVTISTVKVLFLTLISWLPTDIEDKLHNICVHQNLDQAKKNAKLSGQMSFCYPYDLISGLCVQPAKFRFCRILALLNNTINIPISILLILEIFAMKQEVICKEVAI